MTGFRNLSFLTVLLVGLSHHSVSTKNGVLDKDKDSVQISSQIRNYISGPIDGHMLITKYDGIAVYAGPLPPLKDPGKPTEIRSIRKWVMWGDADDPSSLCTLQKAYDFGRIVVFLCPIGGTNVIFSVDDQEKEKAIHEAYATLAGTADNSELICEVRSCLKLFDLSGRFEIPNDVTDEFYKNFKDTIKTTIDGYTQSDPIDVLVESDFCYYWNYRVEQKARVGYIFRESEPHTGVTTTGSYLILEVIIWIIEPNSITESEKNPSLSKLIIGDYSKLLTKRFHSKGLRPCLRKVHPSIELSQDIVFVNERDTELKSAHWRLELRVHTDTLISYISDITFTISSRQHVALFHCFVGDIRVFVDVRDFDFINEAQSDRNQVNWGLSQIGSTAELFLRLKIKHIYGHPTTYVGQAVSRNYQPGDQRTDMVIINNACVAQEFAFTVGGRIYIAERFLKDYQANVIDLVVPGLTFADAEDPKESIASSQRRHLAYLKVTDIAFTPTHVAILMQDSTIYIHSHSIFYKGTAFLTETKKFRIGALVKRRWCARTGTPKTHNMIIPAYSPRGDIILMQVYPVEGSTNMWVTDPPTTCLVKDSGSFEKSPAQIIRENVNETCIHRDELIVRSDERGLDLLPNDTMQECEELFGKLEIVEPIKDTDQLPTYLKNHGELFPDYDPHFPKQLTNLAIHRTAENSTHFNLVLIFEVDRHGEKLKHVLTSNGLELTAEPMKLHSLEFTAVEKMFIAGVVFEAKEFERDSSGVTYGFTMMITTITAINQPIKLHPEGRKEEEPLLTSIPFPGVLIVRKTPYMVKSSSKDPAAATTAEVYITKIFPMNTAMPSYVIDLGNVYVFSSVESKYARPLSYFPRKRIHEIIRKIKKDDFDPATDILLKKDRNSVFNPKDYDCESKTSCTNPSNQLFDILVTEQGTVSVLKRRETDSMGVKDEEGQRIYIGSVMTLDSLREIQPFVSDDNIFQLATPDGEIVYGKYTLRGIGYFRNCIDSDNLIPNQGETCFVQPKPPPELPYCASFDFTPVKCKEWSFVNDTKVAIDDVIGFCANKNEHGCVHKGADELYPPENYPLRELDTAEILGIPFNSLLNGNLQLVADEKITSSSDVDASIGKNNEDRICPFANFDVQYLKFDYAEIGYSTRISASISYLGKNVPLEAELIIEFDNVAGVIIQITSGVVKEKDETTLTKTVDISMTLPDVALFKMKNDKIRTDFRDTTNLAREVSQVFSITIRPSIINLRCKKEDFYITVQYNLGCSPFNEVQLISAASPLFKKIIKRESEAFENFDWRRKGDFLILPREDVWQKQRADFDCNEKLKTECKIPYAYLYGDNIYDLSWRDPFVPQFEQILSERVRRVTGNIILYNLLGNATEMNVTLLDAGCHNNASIRSDEEGSRLEPWFNKLVRSTHSIGRRTNEREDVYKYFADCYDTSELPRASTLELSRHNYNLINRTNFNRMRFDIHNKIEFRNRTKNRNQILIIRAVVINTEFNRFTYCKLMDTFFLLRITGTQAPRQGLQRLDFAIVLIVLIIFFGIIYLFFYKFCTWKLDIPAIPGADQEETDKNEFPWKTQAGPVESDHMIKRLAVKIHAVAKWRQKALQRVVKRFQDEPSQKPDWAKKRLHEDTGEDKKPAEDKDAPPGTDNKNTDNK